MRCEGAEPARGTSRFNGGTPTRQPCPISRGCDGGAVLAVDCWRMPPAHIRFAISRVRRACGRDAFIGPDIPPLPSARLEGRNRRGAPCRALFASCRNRRHRCAQMLHARGGWLLAAVASSCHRPVPYSAEVEMAAGGNRGARWAWEHWSARPSSGCSTTTSCPVPWAAMWHGADGGAGSGRKGAVRRIGLHAEKHRPRRAAGGGHCGKPCAPGGPRRCSRRGWGC